MPSENSRLFALTLAALIILTHSHRNALRRLRIERHRHAVMRRRVQNLRGVIAAQKKYHAKNDH